MTDREGRLIHKQYVHQGQPASFQDLIQNITGLPEETCLGIIRKGGAYTGKLRCKDPLKTVKDGSEVQTWYRLPFQEEKTAFQPVWILHENEQFLVANKPAGMPTQGRRDGDSMAFYQILREHLPGYLGLHHRLDQGTSGLIVFCKDKKLNTHFARLFQEHLIQKHYIALCEGFWPSDQQTIEVLHPIGRLPAHERSRSGKGAVFGKTSAGKKAKTTFELMGSKGKQLLVKATPYTGRTHQIRIHAALEGFPLVGDDLYGVKPFPHPFLLHAFSLSWPKSGPLTAGSFAVGVPENWHSLLPVPLTDILNSWSPQ